MSVFPNMKDCIDWDPIFVHRFEKVDLTRRHVSEQELKNALEKAVEMKNKYDKLLLEIENNPAIKEKPRWYIEITTAHHWMKRYYMVKERYDLDKAHQKISVELHILRLRDIAIATNPFKLYLDFGMRIKARSPAIQIFLVQPAGSGTYVPTIRSVAGGVYGAVPASNLVGPEGGQELVEKTL